MVNSGWCANFKKHHNFHNHKITGEVCAAKYHAAESFPQMPQGITEEHGYLPKQIFTVDEMGLLWKILPLQIYLYTSQDKNTSSGFTVAKE
jgi:hypothetical protein